MNCEAGTQDKLVAARLLQVGCAGPLLSQNGVLHHLGFVVASIAKVGERFAASMGAFWDHEIFHDPVQGVRVTFLSSLDKRNPVFELVEPASEASPVSNFLKKGGGLHHVCYEVDDLESALQEAKATSFTIASRPMPAVAFDGRRIAWVCSRSRMLMELLERGRK